MADFVNLHNHSNYSFLDGMSDIDEMVRRAAELGQPALALTDHQVMTGIVPFYKSCKQHGVKPILGMEGYFTRDRALKGKSGEVNTHLLMLAKDQQGYKNLMKIASIAMTPDYFYHRARADLDLLDKYREGLIITTSCLASPFRKAWLENEIENPWIESVEKLIEIFRDNIFFETQTYEHQDQYDYNDIIRREADRRKIPAIVTSDCHYTRKEDYDSHDIMLAMRMRKYLSNPDRMHHDCNTLYIHSETELGKLGFPESEVSNTKHVADMCNVDLDFSVKFPEQPNSLQQIKDKCEEEMTRRKLDDKKTYQARVAKEIEVIEKTGFPDYFVVLSDIVNWAKGEGIRVGPARGSAAGSLVCMLMGITDVDPIKHKLMFERFLNPDRIGLPDIDVDFERDRRGEVQEHIKEKFGRDRTANICTVNRLGLRQAFKDLAFVHQIPFKEANEITSLIPATAKSLDEAMEEVPELKTAIDNSAIDGAFLREVNRFTGTPRQAGTHAAAMVVAPGPITDYIPLMRVKGEIVTMFDMYAVEDMGLVKFDILGLETLTVIQDTINILAENGQNIISIEEEMNKLDDPDVYGMIKKGKTLGCFQIETEGITALCRDLKISQFQDIVHAISLYRPQVLGTDMMEDYMKNRENPENIKYVHSSLEKHLGETFGIMLFQEQLMQMSMTIGGFTAPQADKLRKGVAKKRPEIITELRDTFIEGARKKGYGLETAKRIFSILEQGGYGFNLSHAVAYATISYHTAWLKYHYPAAFFVSLINSEDDESKLQMYFTEARKFGIQIEPIDINESYYDHTIKGKDIIQTGFKIVKGVGKTAGETIPRARKSGGRFESMEDFLLRYHYSKVTSSALTGMIKAGAFDKVCPRSQLLEEGSKKLKIFEAVDKIKKTKDKIKKSKDQLPLFDLETVTRTVLDLDPELKEYDELMLRTLEKEAAGFFFNDPLIMYEDILRDGYLSSWEEIEENKELPIYIAGMVHDLRVFSYKNRRRRYEEGCIFTVRTLDETIRIAIFGNSFSRSKVFIQESALVAVKGRYNLYKDQKGIVADNVRFLRLDP